MAKGAPVPGSSWARVIATSQEYHVIGTEYFIPQLIEGKKDGPFALYAFFKVIAFPKEGGGTSRILQLNKSKEEKNYFLEEYSERSIIMAKSYGAGKPDIRAVVSHAVIKMTTSRTMAEQVSLADEARHAYGSWRCPSPIIGVTMSY